MKQTKTILEYSLDNFIIEIDKHRQAGWEFDPEVPASLYANRMYEIGFVREVTEEQLAEENKPTRSEILAKARAAKASKKDA